MAIIKWKTGTYGAAIERVECTRETEHCVWMMGRWGSKMRERKALKVSEYDIYHDSWELARDHLLRLANDKIAAERRALELAHSFLGNVKGLRPPAEHSEPSA